MGVWLAADRCTDINNIRSQNAVLKMRCYNLASPRSSLQICTPYAIVRTSDTEAEYEKQ